MSVSIQSNSQSALLSSLDQASGALVNPFEYAISKRIKAHGKTVFRLQPTNAGATTAGTTLSFDLPKSGFIRSMTLKFEVESQAVAGNQLVTPATGFLNAIERVNIESSSRRILTMDRAAIMAAYSDLGAEQRQAFERGLGMHGKGLGRYQINKAALNANGTSIEIFMPLLLSCCDAANQSLQTGFLEPVRVSITWASSFNWAQKASNADPPVLSAHNIALGAPELIVDSILLPPSDEDATIAANFGSGPLSSLVYDYESETDTNATMSAADAAGVTIVKELKSTACATDIYFWVEDVGTYASAAQQLSNRVPLPVEHVSLSASGQTIYDKIPAQFLGCFGRRSLRDGFFGTAASGGYENASTDDDGESGKSAYVYRLQMGLSNEKQYDSGALSLRELNSPTLTVQMAQISTTGYRRSSPAGAAGRPVVMHVVVRKLGLQVVDSSSGRVTSLLSN